MSSIDIQYYVCCGGPLLCPVFLALFFKKSFSPFLFLSFAKVFLSLFTFLAPFFWNSQMSNFSKDRMTYFKKKNIKNSTQTIFQGGSQND